MANTRSAKKRIKQNEKRRLRNRALRSAIRSAVKTARTAVTGKTPKAAEEVHAAEVDKRLRKPGEVSAFAPRSV